MLVTQLRQAAANARAANPEEHTLQQLQLQQPRSAGGASLSSAIQKGGDGDNGSEDGDGDGDAQLAALGSLRLAEVNLDPALAALAALETTTTSTGGAAGGGSGGGAGGMVSGQQLQQLVVLQGLPVLPSHANDDVGDTEENDPLLMALDELGLEAAAAADDDDNPTTGSKDEDEDDQLALLRGIDLEEEDDEQLVALRRLGIGAH